jgi:hypothetical protein
MDNTNESGHGCGELPAACQGGTRAAARALLVVALAAAAGCREAPGALFTDLMEARRVSADLRVQFAKAADASTRAVLADTDEQSVAYVRDAERLLGIVKADVEALAPLVRRIDEKVALKALDDFGRQLTDYEKADRQVLALAGENTNLKAQRLSFGAGRAAADAFRDTVDAAVASPGATDRCRVGQAGAAAVAAVRELQSLWAPHIAEREDAVMTRLEKDMAALDARARESLRALPLPAEARAKEALDRFAGVSAEIVKLSRRNTNVVSTDLALRRLPALAVACDDSLRRLGEALAKNPFPATK